MIEGDQQIFNSGMIVECSATREVVDRIDSYSLILQTTSLTHYLHVVTEMFTIKFLNNNKEDVYSIEIITMSCSCIAGKSCSRKYIVAALLFCKSTRERLMK
ncbi:hypothetical protein PV327_009989 [Microctonus hyperodae]|uniref:Uncharacterized protein n=1 Tax=Microctonus hyperodae TaxID=165561 RepID=A0AA39KG93_MICHY|nr:hypothetical protein PV327_009989 [Microctonus hyperodae]